MPMFDKPMTNAVPAGEIAAAVVVGDEETLDLQVRNARPVDAIMGDDGTEQEDATQDDTGAPADLPEGGEGDVAEGFGTAVGGAAEPDDSGGTGTTGAAEVGNEEAQAELNAWLGAQEDALRERGIII